MANIEILVRKGKMVLIISIYVCEGMYSNYKYKLFKKKLAIFQHLTKVGCRLLTASCGAVMRLVPGALGIFAPSSGPSKMRHGGGRRMPEGMDSC